MKVLVIPEDQTLDGFIAKPIVEAMLQGLGIPGRVDVLPEPRLRGAGDALDAEVIGSIVLDNPMTDLFILIVDRDCDRQSNTTKAAARESEHPNRLIACVAVEELEVWMLALHRDRIKARWQEVRSECDPKERWAQPLLEELGTAGPGGGRKRAMQALSGQLSTLISVCDELRRLQERLAGVRT